MGDPCSNHIFKIPLKLQSEVEVCADVNEEGVRFSLKVPPSPFKVSFKDLKS